jgi:hypothetical protein
MCHRPGAAAACIVTSSGVGQVLRPGGFCCRRSLCCSWYRQGIVSHSGTSRVATRCSVGRSAVRGRRCWQTGGRQACKRSRGLMAPRYNGVPWAAGASHAEACGWGDGASTNGPVPTWGWLLPFCSVPLACLNLFQWPASGRAFETRAHCADCRRGCCMFRTPSQRRFPLGSCCCRVPVSTWCCWCGGCKQRAGSPVVRIGWPELWPSALRAAPCTCDQTHWPR